MEIFKPGLFIDFMAARKYCLTFSALAVAAAIVSLIIPGPKYGIDFRGGTEIELAFNGNMEPGELRKAITDLGFSSPDIVAVEGNKNQYIVRVIEVSTLSPQQIAKIRQGFTSFLNKVKLEELKISPGGDKVSMQLSSAVELSEIQKALESAGVRVHGVNAFGKAEDHRYEARLEGIADKLVAGLKAKLGARVPETPLRAEWVGPKAGEKLRDSAIKSVIYAIVLIMVYVALRFDLRFAPGGVIALAHDVIITLGVYVLIRKEVNITTVAALLTVVGYSINDTIVVYDRIRENMKHMRDASMSHLINISTSQTLSRTVITSGVTLLSIIPFFIWGTPAVRDIVFALFFGITVGTYSSVYIAAPFTEWMNSRFFKNA
jgi:preprotein translocase subunit SecF